jgi:hypothetical protein
VLFYFALGHFHLFRVLFSSHFRALFWLRAHKRESAKKAPAPTSGIDIKILRTVAVGVEAAYVLKQKGRQVILLFHQLPGSDLSKLELTNFFNGSQSKNHSRNCCMLENVRNYAETALFGFNVLC